MPAQTLITRNEGSLTTIGGWDFNQGTITPVSSVNARYNQQYGSYFTQGTISSPGNALYGAAYFTGSNGATFGSARTLATSNAPVYDLLSTDGLALTNNSLGDNATNARSIQLSTTTTLDNARATFKVSTATDLNTFSDINLAYSARNQGSDTAAISWSYSLDGVTFFDITGTSSTIATSGSLYNVFTADLSAIAAINGVESIWLGLNYTENSAAASTFLDNVAIYGTAHVVPFNLWDGASTGDGAQGGDGTWTATSTTWVSAKGTLNRAKTNSTALTPATTSHKAVFGGTAGTITVDNAAGAIDIKDGLQFTTTGYTITGGTLTTDTAATSIEVSGSGTATIASVIAGTGGIDKKDTGTLILSGANTYTGATAVTAGTLRIDGNQSAATGAINVASGATLRGNGTAGGTATLQSGAILAGQSGQTLTLAGLVLNSGSVVNVDLGAPSETTLFRINGNLAFDSVNGTALNIAGLTGFGPGSYRLFEYTGSLTGSLFVGTAPVNTSLLAIETNVANQINLSYSSGGGILEYWKGGAGTWTASGTDNSWTNAGSTTFGAWQPTSAIFRGTAGAVDVSNLAGDVVFTGLQFASTGYVVQGGTLTTNTAQTTVRVGDSLNESDALDAAKTATISSVITGSGGLRKQGAGTLTLSGDNTYTGSTAVNAGTLLISGNQSAATGAYSVASGATLGVGGTGTIGHNVNSLPATVFTVNGTLNNSGTVRGNVTVNNTGVMSTGGTVTGDVTINSGGRSTNTGTIGGNVTVNGLFNGSGSVAGNLTVNNGGVMSTSGTVTGGVTVNSGGTMDASGTVGAVTIANGGTLTGRSGQTLTTNGNLTLDSTSILNLHLGTESSTPLFDVKGALTLDGTMNITGLPNFGVGLYRIFNYTGGLTDNGLTFGTLPSGMQASDLLLNTSVANQVSLQVRDTTTPLPHWTGGSGVWSVDPAHSNWSAVAGSTTKDAWRTGSAIFSGPSGTVTVNTTAGTVAVTAVQFESTGYTVVGGPITINNAGTTFRVGDGTTASSGHIATINSVITGSGGLNKTDYGTLVLGGVNTYTGGTTISTGTLQVANDSALGASSGGITFNGGTLRAAGSGIVTSRNITVNAAGGTMDTGDYDVEWHGAISGTGNMTKSGAGVLTIRNANAQNNFTGTTIISQGEIFLATNSTLGHTTIQNGARLLGNGTVAGNLTNFGTLSPGASAGTLTVTGNYTQTSGGTYHVEIASATSYDRLVVSGNGAGVANLGGSLTVASLNNFVPLPGQSFQILTATGGVNGRFASVTSPFDSLSAMLRFQAVYGSNDVTLQLTQLPFAGLTGSQNQVGIGAALDTATTQQKATGLQAALNSLPAQQDVALALNQLSPQRYQRWFDQAVYSSGAIVRSVESRLTENQGKPTSGLWSELVQRESRFAADSDLPSTDGSAGGFLAGGDAPIGRKLRVGFLVGFTDEELQLDQAGSTTQTERFTSGLYARADLAGFFGEAVGGMSYAKLENKRVIAIPGYQRTAEASAGSQEGFVSLRGGRQFKVGGGLATPYLAGQYVNWRANAMQEDSADDASLRIHAQGRDSVSTRLGGSFAWPLVTSWAVLTPRVDLAWRHEFLNTRRKIEADLAGSTFAVRTQLRGKDGWVGSLGIDAAFGPGFTAYFQVAAERSTGVDKSLDGRAGIDIRF